MKEKLTDRGLDSKKPRDDEHRRAFEWLSAHFAFDVQDQIAA